VAWLSRWRARPGSRTPASLLGAYAAHLTIVEACRAIMNQPMPFVWSEAARDPHACALGRYFDAAGLHETGFGLAHKRFHAVIDQYDTCREAWEDASEALWQGLHEAINHGTQGAVAPGTVLALSRAPACGCHEAADLACVA
jgi:hypothetical protein